MEKIEPIQVWKDGDFALVDPADLQRFLDAGWSEKAPAKAKKKAAKSAEPVEEEPASEPETQDATSEAPKPIKRGRPRKS